MDLRLPLANRKSFSQTSLIALEGLLRALSPQTAGEGQAQ